MCPNSVFEFISAPIKGKPYSPGQEEAGLLMWSV